jgi:RNA polymerase sigma factor (sigma-70 family)
MENERLLKKLANSYSMTTGVEFDDLFQEAYIAYYNAMKTYDPNKSKLSTYVWHCVSSHLRNYVKLEKPYLEMESIETPEVINKPGLSVSGFWDALSFEAQQIAKIMCTKPSFLNIAESDDMGIIQRRKMKQEVSKKIRQTMVRRGWDEKKIRVGIHDLQVALN